MFDKGLYLLSQIWNTLPLKVRATKTRSNPMHVLKQTTTNCQTSLCPNTNKFISFCCTASNTYTYTTPKHCLTSKQLGTLRLLQAWKTRHSRSKCCWSSILLTATLCCMIVPIPAFWSLAMLSSSGSSCLYFLWNICTHSPADMAWQPRRLECISPIIHNTWILLLCFCTVHTLILGSLQKYVPH
jgi:hypothetical protein